MGDVSINSMDDRERQGAGWHRRSSEGGICQNHKSRHSYLGVRMLSLAACLTPLRINLKPISSTSSSLAGAAAAITGLRALTCLAAVRLDEITLVGTMPKRELKT